MHTGTARSNYLKRNLRSAYLLRTETRYESKKETAISQQIVKGLVANARPTLHVAVQCKGVSQQQTLRVPHHTGVGRSLFVCSHYCNGSPQKQSLLQSYFSQIQRVSSITYVLRLSLSDPAVYVSPIRCALMKLDLRYRLIIRGLSQLHVVDNACVSLIFLLQRRQPTSPQDGPALMAVAIATQHGKSC